MQELGIDSSIRTGESVLNEINSVDFPPEHLAIYFGTGSPQPVTVTSLTFNRLDGADSFTFSAYNAMFFPITVTFDGAGNWSGPFSSVTAVTGDDSSTGWRVTGSDLFGEPIQLLAITPTFETNSSASFVEIAFVVPEPSTFALTSLGLVSLGFRARRLRRRARSIEQENQAVIKRC